MKSDKIKFVLNFKEEELNTKNVIYSLFFDNKYYIGQTTNTIKERLGQHKRSCNRGKLNSTQESMLKSEIIIVNILAICKKEELNIFEKKFIYEYKLKGICHNILSGGSCFYDDSIKNKISNSNLNKKMSDSAIKKMSECKKGKSPWNKGISGKKWSDERKEKMKIIHNDESYRKKISDSHKGQVPWNIGIPCRESTKLKQRITRGKGVLCIETGETYYSLSDASEKLGVSKSLIANICKGRIKKSRMLGLSFKYLT